jgi:hypothetical protein
MCHAKTTESYAHRGSKEQWPTLRRKAAALRNPLHRSIRAWNTCWISYSNSRKARPGAPAVEPALSVIAEENRAELDFELVERLAEREERLDTLWPASTRAGEEASRSARCADRGRPPAAAAEEARAQRRELRNDGSPRASPSGTKGHGLEAAIKSANDWVDEANAATG